MEIKSIIAKKLGLNPDESTDEQLIDAINAAELLTDDTRQSIRNQTLNSLTFDEFDKLPGKFVRDVKANLKGAAFEMRENEIISKYAPGLKRGQDFTDMFSLIDRVLEQNSNPDDQLKGQLNSLRTENVALQNQLKESEKTGFKTGIEKFRKFALTNAVESLRNGLVEPSQLDKSKEFLNYTFNNNFDVDFDSEHPTVLDKQSGKIVLNDSGQPKKINEVFKDLASEHTSLQFSKNVATSGRGGQESKPGKFKKQSTEETVKNAREQGKNPFTQDAYKQPEAVE